MTKESMEQKTPLTVLFSIYPFARYRWAPSSALRERNRKYIDGLEGELYDLETDPGETRNLAARDTSKCLDMRNTLRRSLPDWKEGQGEIDSNTRAALESLGYIILPGSSADSRNMPDPRNLSDLLEPIERGLEMIQEGDWKNAESQFRQVVQRNPDNPVVNNNLGLALIRLERPAEAVVFLEAAAHSVPKDCQIQNNLGIALRQSGALSEAESALRRAVALDPTFAPAQLNLAGVLHLMGSSDESAIALDRALSLDPTLANSPTYIMIHNQIREKKTE